jgi:glucokinase
MAGIVGVDIGGSGVRASIVADDTPGVVVSRALHSREIGDVIETVVECAVALDVPIERMGVGVPGFVSSGVVLASPNFPEWRDVRLAGLLRARFGYPVHIENDANAAAYGSWVRAGRQGDLVQLTLGTGVGGGVIQNGKLLRGAGGTGAELGHIYVGGDRQCGCGGVGCLEMHAGTVGLLAAARERGHTVTRGEEVVNAARAGEPWAVSVMEEAADALGRGITTLVNVFNPDVLRFCGGLAAASDLLGPRSAAWLARHGVGPSARRVKLEWGDRAEHDAIVGAAALAVEEAGS